MKDRRVECKGGIRREKKKENFSTAPFLSLLHLLLLLSPPLQGMFWGPAHILFAQCIPAGSLFMSIFLLIRVRLPLVTHLLLL